MATAADILGTMPHPTILATHPAGAEPTYDSLLPAITQLNANAASIPSLDGDGLLGHLVLTIGTIAHALISTGNLAHPAPAAVGPIPIFPANATGAVIAELRQQHADAKRTFQTYYAVDAVLKQLLLASTDERFVITLKDRTHGFALVRTRTIIVHLHDTYGNITSDALSQNEERMKAPWDPTTPIEGLFEQIDDGSAYAIAGRDPFTDTQLVRSGYNNIDSNNKMSIACREWRSKTRAEQTWINFKAHFKAAHLDLRLCTTTGNAGYHANHAQDTNAPTDNATDAYLANLASAALETNAQVTALTATIAQLQTQMTNATAALTRTNNQRPAQRAYVPPTSSTANPRGNTANREERYCWTHGCNVARNHTSANCNNTAEGHQVTATYRNRMGGSTLGCVVL
jgi:hypothetical protein